MGDEHFQSKFEQSGWVHQDIPIQKGGFIRSVRVMVELHNMGSRWSNQPECINLEHRIYR